MIASTLDRQTSRRLLAIGVACLPIAVAYAAVGHYVWNFVLDNPPMPYSALASLIIQSQYNVILFLLWSAFCSAILYAAQLQERERSLLQAQVLTREAELKMLRYQINPHFLFNTLNAVSALIVTGQTHAADEMITKLTGIAPTGAGVRCAHTGRSRAADRELAGPPAAPVRASARVRSLARVRHALRGASRLCGN